jgi:hypothetical protein
VNRQHAAAWIERGEVVAGDLRATDGVESQLVEQFLFGWIVVDLGDDLTRIVDRDQNRARRHGCGGSRRNGRRCHIVTAHDLPIGEVSSDADDADREESDHQRRTTRSEPRT